jgi:type II secretory pathway pseudopilin PulG
MLSKRAGFGMVELILVIGLFAIVGTAGITTVLASFGLNRLADQETEATLFAQDGIEAVLSLRNRGWGNLTAGSVGVEVSNSLWQFGSPPDVAGDFSRTLTLSEVYRDSNGQIATEGGLLVTDTYRLDSVVTWSSGPGRSNQVELSTYLTNFHKAFVSLAAFVSIDLPGNQNATKVQSVGNYAYAIRQGSPVDFIIVNISDPLTPTIDGSLTLDGNSTNIAVSGNFAYVASTSNTQELQIVDISNPSSPTLAGSLDLTGSNDMTGVIVFGNTVYMTRVQGGGPSREFFVIDASVPALPLLLGTLDLADTPNEVYVNGDFAYLASSSNTQELQVISIAVPALPLQVGSLNLGGNGNGVTIDGGSGFVAVGTISSGPDNGFIYLIDVATPASPSLEGSLDSGSSINDLAIGQSDQLAFLATSHPTQEFQVIEIGDRTAPALLASHDGQAPHLGVGYNSLRNWAVAVGQSDTEEIVIYGPQ